MIFENRWLLPSIDKMKMDREDNICDFEMLSNQKENTNLNLADDETLETNHVLEVDHSGLSDWQLDLV